MSELTVSLNKIKKIIKIAETTNQKELTFSFVIGSLFPEAYERIKEDLLKERIKGFNEAKQKYEPILITFEEPPITITLGENNED